MFHCQVLLFLVLGCAALRGVDGKLPISYAIDLATCDNESNTSAFVEKCAFVCKPVRDAQQHCDRNLACTCTTAPLITVQACVQCYLDTHETDPRQVELLMPSRLIAYSQLCGPDPTPNNEDIEITTNSTARHDTKLEGRETLDAVCIYGLPDVAGNNIMAFLEAQRNLWPYVAFALVVLLCVVERRSKAS